MKCMNAGRLYSEAYPGGPHEHTLLVVLGDHGQVSNQAHLRCIIPGFEPEL